MAPTRAPYPKTFKLVTGMTPVDIEVALADLAIQVPADQEIVELGTYHGKTALVLAWGASQGDGAHVTTIDAWDLDGNTWAEDPDLSLSGARAWSRYHIRNLGYTNRISLVQNFSSDHAAVWKERTGKQVGLLFIDGEHDYASTSRDVTDWTDHLAPGAIIAVNDYGNENYPGVKMALDDLVESGVLEPLQIFHDRLAVTRLVVRSSPVTAITSEGVSPAPVEEPEDLPEVDAPVSIEELELVREGELGGTPAGTALAELNIGRLRSLARVRGIRLAPNTSRDGVLAALRAGS